MVVGTYFSGVVCNICNIPRAMNSLLLRFNHLSYA